MKSPCLACPILKPVAVYGVVSRAACPVPPPCSLSLLQLLALRLLTQKGGRRRAPPKGSPFVHRHHPRQPPEPPGRWGPHALPRKGPFARCLRPSKRRNKFRLSWIRCAVYFFHPRVRTGFSVPAWFFALLTREARVSWHPSQRRAAAERHGTAVFCLLVGPFA